MEHIKESRSGHFKPKAQILTLLGEELIKSPVMAIYELIKNAYDADAKKVEVHFFNADDKDFSKITIQDDGYGIDEETLENVWLEPGSDHRKPFNKERNRVIIKTPFRQRIPMGEKGIGRFAVHRLANEIKLITRPKKFSLDAEMKAMNASIADYEIELNIDWRIFQQSKYLNDVKITWIKKHDPETFHFKTDSGTRIELSEIKESWSRRMALDLKRETISMISPNANPAEFKIDLQFHNEWLRKIPDAQEVLDHAPYKFLAVLDKDYNLEYDYVFKPKFAKIDPRSVEKARINIKNMLKERISTFLAHGNPENNDVEKHLEKLIAPEVILGSLMFEINSFNMNSEALQETILYPRMVREILKNHHGIKVYKGDLRIYNYGEPGNDWLGLDLRRVQRVQGNISNNQNIGYVHVQPEKSLNLIEKANREGFLENDSYTIFVGIINIIIDIFLAERYLDQDRWMRSIEGLSEDDVRRDISSLIQKIDAVKEISPESKDSIRKEILKIDKKIEDERQTLLIPAMLGMSVSMTIHELEKLTPRLIDIVNKVPLPLIRLKENVYELEDYVSNLTEVIRRKGFKKESVKSLIEKVLEDFDYKFEKYGIKTDKISIPDDLFICCERRSVIPALRNIVDNSIYWLYISKEVGNRFLFVAAQQIGSRTGIIIADNGIGFQDNLTKLVKPFFTRKPDGMGIGLYLVDQVMLSHGKLALVRDPDRMVEYALPTRYRTGAIVELIFDKDQECKD